MMTFFVTAIVVLSIFLISAIFHIGKLQRQIILLDKEQHTQNKDIIDLMKVKIQHDEMLLQHIEILKYLIEQDPKMRAHKVLFQGPVGEA